MRPGGRSGYLIVTYYVYFVLFFIHWLAAKADPALVGTFALHDEILRIR